MLLNIIRIAAAATLTLGAVITASAQDAEPQKSECAISEYTRDYWTSVYNEAVGYGISEFYGRNVDEAKKALLLADFAAENLCNAPPTKGHQFLKHGVAVLTIDHLADQARQFLAQEDLNSALSAVKNAEAIAEDANIPLPEAIVEVRRVLYQRVVDKFFTTLDNARANDEITAEQHAEKERQNCAELGRLGVEITPPKQCQKYAR